MVGNRPNMLIKQQNCTHFPTSVKLGTLIKFDLLNILHSSAKAGFPLHFLKVHVSDPYMNMKRIRVWYRVIFVADEMSLDVPMSFSFVGLAYCNRAGSLLKDFPSRYTKSCFSLMLLIVQWWSIVISCLGLLILASMNYSLGYVDFESQVDVV